MAAPNGVWQRRAAAVLVVAAAIVAWSALDAGAKRVAIDRDDVIGVWVGLTTDDLDLIRLDLAPEGDGLLGYLFSDATPCVFRLRSWSFSKGQIGLELGDLGHCAPDRQFHAVVAGSTLNLMVQGDGWKRQALLKKEAPLVGRWEKLRAAMIEIAGRHQ